MILANLNEKITTDVIIKNSNSSILESNILEFESNILKSAFDYGDDCNEDGSCSCGGGHNKIELPDKTTVLESEEMDTNTIIHGIDSIVIENLILGQSDMNIPIIALQMGVIFLMGLIIEVSNAWKGIRIKNKVKSLVWKKDNNKSGPKFLDAPVSWGLYFQDAASPSFEGIVDLHNRIMFYLVIISFGVSWVMLSVMTNFNYSSNKLVYRHLNHGKYVPVQKDSKFKNIISHVSLNGTDPFNLKSKRINTKRYYATLSNNSLNINKINYVKIYENAYDNKKILLEENKGKSGIYMLANKLTNLIYIGQSKDISKRFIRYFNASYIKSKKSFKISRALIKYGYSNFSVRILEYCDKSDLTIREQFYLDNLNPEYNILKIAGSSRGYRHSKETKAKISKSLKGIYIKEKSPLFGRKHTEETKILMSKKKAKHKNPMYGKTHNKNTIKLMRQKALGRVHSDETKLKMSVIRGNPVIIYEKCSLALDGFTLIGSFVSARRASKFLGISHSTVSKYMYSGEIYKERYKFSSK
jgi:group I intron endonuclease